jgi:hypothetical protein
VLERRLQLSLAAKPPDELGVPGELRPQDLQRDASAERQLHGLIDDAHAALAEPALDAVTVDGAFRFDQVLAPWASIA